MKRDNRQFLKTYCIRIDNDGRTIVYPRHLTLYSVGTVGYIQDIVSDAPILIQKKKTNKNKKRKR